MKCLNIIVVLKRRIFSTIFILSFLFFVSCSEKNKKFTWKELNKETEDSLFSIMQSMKNSDNLIFENYWYDMPKELVEITNIINVKRNKLLFDNSNGIDSNYFYIFNYSNKDKLKTKINFLYENNILKGIYFIDKNKISKKLVLPGEIDNSNIEYDYEKNIEDQFLKQISFFNNIFGDKNTVSHIKLEWVPSLDPETKIDDFNVTNNEESSGIFELFFNSITNVSWNKNNRIIYIDQKKYNAKIFYNNNWHFNHNIIQSMIFFTNHKYLNFIENKTEFQKNNSQSDKNIQNEIFSNDSIKQVKDL